MRKITLTAAEAPTIDINGTQYEIQLSDTQISELLTSIQNKYMNFGESGETGTNEILEAVQCIGRAIDAILGDGALAGIAEGRPVSFRTALSWLVTIAGTAISAWADQLEEEYR